MKILIPFTFGKWYQAAYVIDQLNPIFKEFANPNSIEVTFLEIASSTSTLNVGGDLLSIDTSNIPFNIRPIIQNMHENSAGEFKKRLIGNGININTRLAINDIFPCIKETFDNNQYSLVVVCRDYKGCRFQYCFQDKVLSSIIKMSPCPVLIFTYNAPK